MAPVPPSGYAIGCPPNQNPGYAVTSGHCPQKVSSARKSMVARNRQTSRKTSPILPPVGPLSTCWSDTKTRTSEINKFAPGSMDRQILLIYRGSSYVLVLINRTEQNRTLYFDREVSVHIYKYIHIQNSYASSNRTLCIN